MDVTLLVIEAFIRYQIIRTHEHEKDGPMVITFILHDFEYIHHFIRFQQFKAYKNEISLSDEFLTPVLSTV